MKQNLSDILVSVLLIACTAAVLFALTIALGDRTPPAARTLEVDFPDVAGIAAHSEVRYAGMPAGRVAALRPLTDAERAASPHPAAAVRVTLALHDPLPSLRADTKAGIGSDTLLSEKYVTLSAGSPDGAPLAEGTVLRGEPAFNIDAIGGRIDPLLKDAEALLATARKSIETLSPELTETAGALKGAVASAKTALETADATLKRADALLAENKGELKDRLVELRGVIASAGRAIDGAERLMRSTDTVITDTGDQLDGRMAELAVILQNLKVATTHAKALTETLGTNPSKLIWGGKRNTLTPEHEILRSPDPVPAKQPPPSR